MFFKKGRNEMKQLIEIGGKPTEFEATAMTDHMVDAIFKINIAYAVTHTEGNEEKYPDLVKKIAFVMIKRAELGGWRKVESLTQDDYFDWLDSIDSYSVESAAQEIMTLYANNKKTAVHPKN